MNTPSHAILNLALLSQAHNSQAYLIIVMGGVLPDIPIFLFYGWAKFITKIPAAKIWSEAYYQPNLQNIVAIFHSIPLAMFGWGIAYFYNWESLQILCLSLILHSLFDLPVHHDDAHRHFFPVSHYRFISPISYWDINHYGRVVAFIEMVGVLFATVWVFPLLDSVIGKSLMLWVNGFYGWGYFYFYLRSQWSKQNPL
jgi:hypothetical protein